MLWCRPISSEQRGRGLLLSVALPFSGMLCFNLKATLTLHSLWQPFPVDLHDLLINILVKNDPFSSNTCSHHHSLINILSLFFFFKVLPSFHLLQIELIIKNSPGTKSGTTHYLGSGSPPSMKYEPRRWGSQTIYLTVREESCHCS